MATSCNSFSIDILNMVAFSQGNMFDQFDPGAVGIASQSDVDLSRFRISVVGREGFLSLASEDQRPRCLKSFSGGESRSTSGRLQRQLVLSRD